MPGGLAWRSPSLLRRTDQTDGSGQEPQLLGSQNYEVTEGNRFLWPVFHDVMLFLHVNFQSIQKVTHQKECTGRPGRVLRSIRDVVLREAANRQCNEVHSGGAKC